MIEFLGNVTLLIGGAYLAALLGVSLTLRYNQGGLESMALALYVGTGCAILWGVAIIAWWHL